MKKALITGANGGLGKELLNRFSLLGYDIIATYRSGEEEFKQFCNRIESASGREIVPVYVDLSNKSSLEKFISFLEADESNIDMLINCAGVNIVKPTFNVEWQDLELSFRVNYFAPVLISKTVAAKMMMQGHGNIINISSVMANARQTGGSCYNSTKAALNQFTKTLAQELAPFNIRVNAVAPGTINTSMFDNLPPKTQKSVLKKIAFQRPAFTSEIVDVVEFLASDKSTYITGSIIKVDGGAIL